MSYWICIFVIFVTLILISCMFSVDTYAGDNDNPLYLLTFDHQGHNCRVSLDYNMSQAQMTEVDLAGRELSGASGTLNFARWQIKTVRITPARQ